MLFARKLISNLFFPLPLTIYLLLAGLLLLLFTKRQKTAKVLLTLGCSLLLVFSYGIFTQSLYANLENYCQPVVNIQAVGEMKWVVVLGGGFVADERLPLSSRLSVSSLTRLVEGIRLYRQLPGSKLLVSGGRVFNPTSEAQAMGEMAVALGVPQQDIVEERDSANTQEQASILKDILHQDKFILVTSASHMRRAATLFHKQGLYPMLVPTQHRMSSAPQIHPGVFFPNSGNLQGAETLFYETLGYIWAWWRGQI